MSKRGTVTALEQHAAAFRGWCGGLLIAGLCSCAAPPMPNDAAPVRAVSPAAARIWIYRDYEPYETLAQPYVRLNGQVVGKSEPGGAFFRDVAPGSYSVTVDSTGQDINQFVQIALAAGQTAFIKIESEEGWESDLERRVDTFYTRPISPAVAKIELTGRRLQGGE